MSSEIKQGLSSEIKQGLSSEIKQGLSSEMEILDQRFRDVLFGRINIPDFWKQVRAITEKILKDFKGSLSENEKTSIITQYSSLDVKIQKYSSSSNAKVQSSIMSESSKFLDTMTRLEMLKGVGRNDGNGEAGYRRYYLCVDNNMQGISTFGNALPKNYKLNIAEDIRKDVERLTDPNIQKALFTPEWIKNLGKRMSCTLFPREIMNDFNQARKSAGNKISINLRIDNPDTFNFPWEVMFFEDYDRYIVTDSNTPLVRVVPSPHYEKRDFGQTIRILLIGSNPTVEGLSHVQVEQEKKIIKSVLDDIKANTHDINLNYSEVDIATVPAILAALSGPEKYDIIHFMGHGTFDKQKDKGYLALVKECDGGLDEADEEKIAELFQNHHSIKLFILNACQGAPSSSYKAFHGIAPWLVRQGIPAVIAMRYSITNRIAHIFSETFYSNIARYSIEENIQLVRNRIKQDGEADLRDFISPVLFVGIEEESIG